MSEFSKRMADSIRDEEKSLDEAKTISNTESAAFVERERLKRSLGPDLWRKFRETIVFNCNEVNKELGREYYRVQDEFPNKLRVARLNPVAHLWLDFYPDTHQIHYSAGENAGYYLIGIDETTGQATLTDAKQRKMELELTAEFLLEDHLAKASA